MADIKKIVNDARDEIVKKIDAYNTALKENDAAKANCIEQELRGAEAAYAEVKCVEVFGELAKKENPVEAAVAMHSYLVVSHKVKRDNGVIVGFEIVEDKSRDIDLVKFCEYCRVPTLWKYKVERFNKLLALRLANELKMTKAQIKRLCEKFHMSEQARQLELGETPDSNTQICKRLQEIFDEVLFEDNGKGKNTYKVNNHDVAYLLSCYSKRGKKTCSVSVAKTAYMHRLLLDVMHRVVTNKVYDLEYRELKDAPAVAPKSEKPVITESETVVVEKKSA